MRSGNKIERTDFMNKKYCSRVAESPPPMTYAPVVPENPSLNQPKKKRIRPRTLCLLVFVISALAAIVILGISLGSVARQNEELRRKNSELDQNNMQLARDLEQCYTQIADLEKQIAAAGESVNALTSRNSQLASDVNALQGENWKLKRVADFFNENAVILPNDGSGIFHKYECSKLNTYSGFWIYNTESAFYRGYDPCTSCMQTGYYIGNVNSHVYHRPTCWTLPDLRNRTYFDTTQEAKSAGYRACGNCDP